jgi:ABC-type branched-subunit amino acid transport system substrate-binding protein
MLRQIYRVVFGLALMLLAIGVLVACGGAAASPTTAPPTSAPAATSAPAPTTAPAAAGSKTFTIGFTTSQTGSLNVESGRQLHGLQLWLDDVTKAGGIKLKDGTVLMPALKFYDDESKSDRVQALYTKLINDDKVDFLISPYSSGLTKTAAVVSEQNSKVMITTGAADDATMEQGYKGTYQLYTPASQYLTGAIDLLQKLSPDSKNIAIPYEKDAFSTSVAAAAQTYAKSKGYNVVVYEGFDSNTTDFSALVDKISAANPDAIMGGGHLQNGSDLAKQLYDKKVSVKMLALLVAPAEPTFTNIGEGADYVVGPSQWEPQVTFSADSAKAANLPWYGVANADFISEYKAKYNEDPTYHSAGGYAAGMLLQKAIEDAGSLDSAKIEAALDGMDVLTFYGHVKFSTDAKTHGKQVAHEMVLIQWQKDSSGKLAKQIVWPDTAKTADPQLRQ